MMEDLPSFEQAERVDSSSDGRYAVPRKDSHQELDTTSDGAATQHSCKTVMVRCYNDGLDPRYAIIKNATVLTPGGCPNGDMLGKANDIQFEGVPIEPETYTIIGDYHSDTTLLVSIDEGVATITRSANG